MKRTQEIIDLCLKYKVSFNLVLDVFGIPRMCLFSDIEKYLADDEVFERVKDYVISLA